MAKTVCYPNLEGKIAERGYTKADIARSLGISARAFNNKTNGKTPFTWPEVCIIQNEYFPDLSKEVLFTRSV